MFDLFSRVRTTDVLSVVNVIFGFIRAFFGIKKEVPVED